MSIADLGITTRSLTAADLPFLQEFLADIFTRKEPILSALKITVEAHKSFTTEVRDQFSLDLSTVACLPTGQIIACFLALPLDAKFDVTKIDPSIMGTLGPAFVLMEAFIKDVIMKRNAERSPESQLRVLNYVSGATADPYENMGISKKLRAETIEKSKRAGWDMAVVQCTNSKTQHIMRDVYGFNVVQEMQYADYEEKGKKPYENIEGSMMLLYKDLQ